VEPKEKGLKDRAAATARAKHREEKKKKGAPPHLRWEKKKQEGRELSGQERPLVAIGQAGPWSCVKLVSAVAHRREEEGRNVIGGTIEREKRKV